MIIYQQIWNDECWIPERAGFKQIIPSGRKLHSSCDKVGFWNIERWTVQRSQQKYLKVKVRANNKDIFNQTIPGQIKELPICRTVWAVFGKSHWQMNVTMSQKVESEKGSATSTCHVPCELCLERLTGRRREDSWGQCAFAVAPEPVIVFLYFCICILFVMVGKAHWPSW